MPSSNKVLCAHCNVWMSQKWEWQHHGLLFTPYVSPPPKLSLRFTHLLDSDSKEDPAPIPDVHQDGTSSKFGQNGDQSDYDEPAQMDGSFNDNDNEADQNPVEVDDDILVVQNVHWGTMLRDKTHPDNEESDHDLEEVPVKDAGDKDGDVMMIGQQLRLNLGSWRGISWGRVLNKRSQELVCCDVPF
jgi:hypothetical protein